MFASDSRVSGLSVTARLRKNQIKRNRHCRAAAAELDARQMVDCGSLNIASRGGSIEKPAIMKLLTKTLRIKKVSRPVGFPPIVWRNIIASAANPAYVMEIVASAYRYPDSGSSIGRPTMSDSRLYTGKLSERRVGQGADGAEPTFKPAWRSARSHLPERYSLKIHGSCG